MDAKGEVVARQYLSFILREDYYAVEIVKVREVLDVATLTRIPRMPDYLCGVINLRGAVVPVVDLGLQLGMAPYERDVNTCIIIIELLLDHGLEVVQIGVLADKVQAVLDLGDEAIEAVPRMGAGIDTRFIKGMGRQDDKFLILLDIDTILASLGESGTVDLRFDELARHEHEVVA